MFETTTLPTREESRPPYHHRLGATVLCCSADRRRLRFDFKTTRKPSIPRVLKIIVCSTSTLSPSFGSDRTHTLFRSHYRWGITTSTSSPTPDHTYINPPCPPSSPRSSSPPRHPSTHIPISTSRSKTSWQKKPQRIRCPSHRRRARGQVRHRRRRPQQRRRCPS